MFSVFAMFAQEYEELPQAEKEYVKRLQVERLAQNVDNLSQKREGLLIGTCDPVRFSQIKSQDIAVFGIALPGEKQPVFADCPMVIEGFEEVDREFLNRIYRRCHRLPWTIAETDRLVIRETIAEDLPVFEGMYEDSAVQKFLEPLYAKGAEDPVQYLEYLQRQYDLYGFGIWTLVCEDTVIGRAGLKLEEDSETGEETAFLGYMLGADYRGHGYAYEACSAILQLAKEEFGFSQICCSIHEENRTSLHLAEKLGFLAKVLNNCKQMDMNSAYKTLHFR